MKVIAISQRVDVILDRDEVRDALDQRLISLIEVCGFLPVPVPNKLGKSIGSWLEKFSPAGVLLSGGNDLGERPERDKTEIALLKYADHHRLPMVGICRGMQMMASVEGVGLKKVNGHVKTRHQLSGRISEEVNSFHNYSLEFCPDGYEILATSEDGSIEAMVHTSLNWQGWMWHPERENPFLESDLVRLRKIFGG